MVWGQSLWSELLGGRTGEAGLVSAPLKSLGWYGAALVPVQWHVQPLLGLGTGGR